MVFKMREDHWQIIISFMEEHKEFASGRISHLNGREEYKKLWTELSLKLNSLGYGERTVEKWQKSWADYKSNLKKKASEIKNWQLKTGGGPGIEKQLTNFEQRALEIMGHTSYAGSGVKEIGLEHTKENEPHIQSPHNQLPITEEQDDNTISSKRPHSTCHDDHDYLVKNKKIKQTVHSSKRRNDCNKVYEDTINALKSIENTVGHGLENINKTLDTRLENIQKAVEKYLGSNIK